MQEVESAMMPDADNMALAALAHITFSAERLEILFVDFVIIYMPIDNG